MTKPPGRPREKFGTARRILGPDPTRMKMNGSFDPRSRKRVTHLFFNQLLFEFSSHSESKSFKVNRQMDVHD